MSTPTQPLGAPSSSTPAQIPNASSPTSTLTGKYVSLRPLTNSDIPALFTSLCGPSNASLWTYLPFAGPYDSLEAFTSYIGFLISNISSTGDFPFVITKLSDSKIVGISCLINIVPAHRRAEIGFVTYARELQRTREATEVAYLLLNYAFGLGNERVEWKLDALNGPSKRAAERYGFTYEGTFRKHMVVKGRRRDTSWYSIIDDEWNANVKHAFEAWLSDDNFDERGQQIKKLEEFRK
ncbi:Acyl-CoA N-acyltransferases (Nat) [Glarea lozoyensis ATCC 20868]|uniref:Acyl-CoA N-acyltransferases (Nat) n=1 Tax=Glarea lozoyensis (strain ATCC 20868 / MF5171) TaxID=1116229 RepID=S3EC23_GLAL2|nr:Acyl-CoA N-acyltransferases (Nat) [Glarea lozoyensis ATCC 20868]EPE35843.1 Acyl-CoA N-acyltransferases (Nat) [Glarea lozoyensis ATCC 20868]